MLNEKKKIILLIVFDIILIISIIFFYQLFHKLLINIVKEASPVTIIGGADGPTTIYVFPQLTWKIILVYLVYLLSFVMSGLIILSIMNIVEYINTKKLFLKYKIIIIMPINLLLTILLFPSMIILSILIDIVVIIVLIIVKPKKKLSYKKIKKLSTAARQDCLCANCEPSVRRFDSAFRQTGPAGGSCCGFARSCGHFESNASRRP
jgi:Na+-transporting methylmalonyl-CoA/oxaloacetate decarboxylase beta subunit